MKYHIVIGYDRANRIPAYAIVESILHYSSVPVSFTFLHRGTLKEFTRPRGDKDSTDFSNSRFLTPYLAGYTGWSLFLDNDMIVRSDIKELFDLADDAYSVMCVKHNQVINGHTKFLGHEQTEYSCKNWSSVMLFNNAKCTKLTPSYVNTAHGLDMHQFKWLDTLNQVGSLPLEWNYLVGNKNQTDLPPKLLHYTDGGPYFVDYADCEYSEEFNAVYNRLNDYQKH